jgi:thiosulfate reductase cytochrome b subunit
MQIHEKHSAWLRWNHWLNFPILTVMVWSGVLIYWSNDVYPFFFPAWFYSFFHIKQRLAEGMAIHFTIAWLFAINSVAFLIYLFGSGHWRELFPDRQTARDLWPTILRDLGFRAREVAPEKFNAAQKFTYTGVIGLGFVEFLTGFAIYKPVQLRWLTFLFGGYDAARAIHFIVMVFFVAFFFLHILQVARAGWNAFRAMIVGFEVSNDK